MNCGSLGRAQESLGKLFPTEHLELSLKTFYLSPLFRVVVDPVQGLVFWKNIQELLSAGFIHFKTDLGITSILLMPSVIKNYNCTRWAEERKIKGTREVYQD